MICTIYVLYHRKRGLMSKCGKFDVSFSMVSEKEYDLIVNAIKRQVDYYRNRVFNLDKDTDEKTINNTKYCYKVYCDLYKKIINDYGDTVKVY